MTITSHSIAQILATILQGINMFGGFVPAKYQPVVAFALTVVQGGLALYNHYFSPAGAKLVAALLFALLCVGGASAQNTPPTNQSTFSLTSSALALPGGKQTVAGTDVGGTFALSEYVSLRSDNIIAPGSNFSGFFGGIQYFLPTDKLFAKASKLNSSNFQAYLMGSAGVDRIVALGVPDKQHYAFLAGGGVNYAPSGNKTFSVNLFEVKYAKLPGLANNTAIVSSGLKLSF